MAKKKALKMKTKSMNYKPQQVLILMQIQVDRNQRFSRQLPFVSWVRDNHRRHKHDHAQRAQE